MNYVFNDGGRAAAGFKGTTGDCGVRAIAIAAEMPYKTVYDLVNEFCAREVVRGKKTRSNARTGVHKDTLDKVLASLGWEWVSVMKIGTGCTMHMRPDELPKGRIIVRATKHFAAVVDGITHDTYDSTRDGTRCVYGYWRKK